MNGPVLRPILLAAGAVCALLATLAVFDQSWELAYAWLGAGLLGDLALSHLSGKLDAGAGNELRVRSAILYLNTVFVPALALMQAGFLEGATGAMVAALIILSGTYRLGFQDWASPVPIYNGFPAAWGGVGFALHAFDATRVGAALVIGAALILSLVPAPWPHPVYSPRWTTLTRAVTLGAAVLAGNILWHGFPAGVQAKSVIVLVALYGAGLAVAEFMTGAPNSGSSSHTAALGLAGLDEPDHAEQTGRTGATGPHDTP